MVRRGPAIPSAFGSAQQCIHTAVVLFSLFRLFSCFFLGLFLRFIVCVRVAINITIVKAYGVSLLYTEDLVKEKQYNALDDQKD